MAALVIIVISLSVLFGLITVEEALKKVFFFLLLLILSGCLASFVLGLWSSASYLQRAAVFGVLLLIAIVAVRRLWH